MTTLDGAQVEVTLGEQANVNLVGIVGPPGPTGPPGPAGPAGLSSGGNNVKAFGAFGDGVHDDTAAINAAFAAGPSAYVPTGTYNVSGPLVPPVRTGNSNAMIRGDGTASLLRWTVDIGSQANNVELAQQGIGLDCCNKQVDVADIALAGPGTFQVGQVKCYMSGLGIGQQSTVRNVQCNGFYAGVVFGYATHVYAEKIHANNNYYGALWPVWSNAGGDLNLVSCSFVANNLAGWKLGNGMGWQGCYETDLTISNSPVAILISDNFSGWDTNGNPAYAGTAITGTRLLSSFFYGMDMEGIGNVAILDISSSGTGAAPNPMIWHCQFFNVGITYSATYRSTLAPIPVANQNTGQWDIVCNIGNSDFYYNQLIKITVPPIATFKASGFNVYIPGDPQNMMWAPTAGVLNGWLSQSGAGSVWANMSPDGISKQQTLPHFIDANNGEVVVMTAGAAITLGQLVEWNAAYHPVPATGTKELAGIAVSTAASGNPVAIQISGYNAGHISGGAVAGQAVTYGQLLSTFSTTPSQVGPAASNAGQPIFGVALNSVGIGSVVFTKLRT